MSDDLSAFSQDIAVFVDKDGDTVGYDEDGNLWKKTGQGWQLKEAASEDDGNIEFSVN